MTENTRTPFAGLLRVAPGEPLSLEGFELQFIDPLVIDTILKIGAVTHKHDGADALAAPTELMTLAAEATGGSLPASTTFKALYTLIDAQGGETLPTAAVSVKTEDAFPEPKEVPTAEVKTTAGALLAANYLYGATVTDGEGGETTISPLVQAVVPSGSSHGEVLISKLKTILTEVAGATVGAEWRLWRKINGGEWYLMVSGATEDFLDEGAIPGECNVQPPTTSTTHAACKLSFKLPKVPSEEALAYRVYLTDETGFGPVCFYAEYPAAEFGKTIDVSTLTVEPGSPPPVARAFPHANKIDPDTEMIEWPWKKPVADAAALPATENKDGDVRETLNDHALHVWDQGEDKWDALAGGGGGGSTLVIENPSGTEETVEPKLQFVGSGVTVAGDPTNERTVVTIAGGSLIEYKGAWDAETAYDTGNIVTAGGGSYIALDENTGVDPTTNVEHWGILAAPGAAGTGEGVTWLGAWSNGTTYAVNDAVSRLGSSYINKSAGNVAHDPSTDAGVHWDVIAEAGAGLVWRGEWAIGTSYDERDLVQAGGSTYISKAAGNVGHDPTTDVTHTYWEGFVARGATGAAGGVGPEGLPGPPGAGFNWKGVWNSGTAYAAGDGVQAGGSAFVATGASTGVSPLYPNLAGNGGAESSVITNLEQRKGATVTRDATHVKDGAWAYKVITSAGSQNSGMGLKGLKWSSGQHLRAEAWVYGEEGQPWRMALYASGSSFIQDTGTFGTDGWNLVSVSGAAPSATAEGSVVIDDGAHNDGMTWWIDDIRVVAGNWDLISGGPASLLSQVESHTWALPGEVVEGVRPGFFTLIGEGEAKQFAIAFFAKTEEGQCQVTVRVNGAAVPGLTEISVETSVNEVKLSEEEWAELATADYIDMEVLSPESAAGLAATLFIAKY